MEYMKVVSKIKIYTPKHNYFYDFDLPVQKIRGKMTTCQKRIFDIHIWHIFGIC